MALAVRIQAGLPSWSPRPCAPLTHWRHEELWPGVLGYMGEEWLMCGGTQGCLMDSREKGDPGTYPNAPVMPQLTGLGLSQCPGLTHAPVRPIFLASLSAIWIRFLFRGVGGVGGSAGNLISFPEVLTLTPVYIQSQKEASPREWVGRG